MTGSNTGAAQTPVLTNRDYIKTMLRSYFLQNGFNYSNYQGLGYANVIYPALKKIHGDDKQALCEDLEKNSEFYNTNPVLVPFITSLHLAMADQGMDYDEVRGLKMALMGPLAGIGDSIVQGIIVPILLSIGMSLAAGGSAIGPLFYIITWGIIGPAISFFCFRMGYKLGVGAVDMIVGEAARRLTDAFNVLGIMVIGALSAGNIVLTTTLNIPMGGEFKPLQDTLDGCFPGILPLIAVLLTWWMLNKKQYSPTKVIIILCVVVAVLCVIGVF